MYLQTPEIIKHFQVISYVFPSYVARRPVNHMGRALPLVTLGPGLPLQAHTVGNIAQLQLHLPNLYHPWH